LQQQQTAAATAAATKKLTNMRCSSGSRSEKKTRTILNPNSMQNKPSDKEGIH